MEEIRGRAAAEIAARRGWLGKLIAHYAQARFASPWGV